MSAESRAKRAYARMCPSCGAKPGDPCIDKHKYAKGKTTANPHHQRFEERDR